MFGEIIIIALIALFCATVAVLIVSALRWIVSGGIRDAAKKSDTAAGNRNARQILDERYARGEIGREEYAQIRQDIEAG